MKRILTSAVLIPLVLLAVFRAPLSLFLLITVVVALAAVFEYLSLVAKFGLEPFRLLTYIYTASLFCVLLLHAGNGGRGATGGKSVAVLFAPFLLMTSALPREDLKAALGGAAMSYVAIPYIGLPLILLSLLRSGMYRGWVYVLFTFLAVWVGDAAAMYVGKSMGKHKLAPRISPGKTIEGSLASLIFSIAACCLFSHYLPEIAALLSKAHLIPSSAEESLLLGTPAYGRAPLWIAALLAGVINLAAQLGDLLESALKRGAGVKDSGILVPGHGGILDRIDALLLAFPVAFLLFMGFGQKFVKG